MHDATTPYAGEGAQVKYIFGTWWMTLGQKNRGDDNKGS